MHTQATNLRGMAACLLPRLPEALSTADDMAADDAIRLQILKFIGRL